VLTLAISHHSSLLVRVDEKSDGVIKDVLRIQEVLGICYPSQPSL